jgi:hypothetical protein
LASGIFLAKPFWHDWTVRNVEAIPFDSTAWSTAPDDDTRLRMVNDLIAKYRLAGMHEQDLIDLLGEERDVRSPKRNLTYLLSPGFMDPIILVIVLDSTGRAVRVAVEST